MGTRLGHWRPSEDERLKEIVAQYGPHNWKAIAEKLEGRSGKSCRLRWFNQLDPRLNRSPFTEEEEQLLLALQRVHGNRWAVIAKLLGHTDNAVKNSWHVIMARPCRERMRQSSTAAGAWKDESTRNTGSGKLRLSETSAMAAKYPREYAGAGPSAISHHSSKEGCFSSTIDGTNRSVEFHDFM